MNLSFLNPGFLFLLPLGLFPIILHLFYKRKPRHILFSDLKFIQLAIKNVAPKKKIHQWLILILRCLVLILLCLAFARPIGHIGSHKQSTLNKQILILLDTSYSMQYSESGEPRFNVSKSFALKLIDRFLPPLSPQKDLNKQLGVVLFSNRVDKYLKFTNDAKIVREFISQTKTTYNSTDLAPALKLASEMFNENPSNSNCSVIVISDMAQHLLGKDFARLKSINPYVRIIFVNVGSEKYENVFVENMTISKSPIQFNATLNNLSDRDQPRIISIRVNSRKIQDNIVNLPGNRTYQYEAVYNDKTVESIYGSMNLQEDSLATDDVFYFVSKTEKQKRILVIDGDPEFGYSINSESYYLSQALNNANIFLAEIVSLDEAQDRQDLNMYDCIFMCNVKSPLEHLASLLKKFVSSGDSRTLMVFLGDKADPAGYPDWIGENIGTLQNQESAISEYGDIKNILPDIDKFELSNIKFKTYFRLSEKDGATMLKLNNGDPLLVAKMLDNSRVYIFASTADRAWTNMPSKPFYPYLVNSIAKSQETLTNQEETGSISVGQPIGYSPEFDFSDARIIKPGGETVSKGISKISERRISFDGTDVPGIYELILTANYNKKMSKYFAVNLPDISLESNLNKIEFSKITKSLPKIPSILFNISDDSINKIVNAIEGKELFRQFLMIALLLLGIEVVLANL